MNRIRSIATVVDALHRCEQNNNEWGVSFNTKSLEDLMASAPSGSGIDSGTTLDVDASSANKIVFHADFHHMNGSGFYDGWTEHTITVRPDLVLSIRLTISGQNFNGIKDYLYELFDSWLLEETTE